MEENASSTSSVALPSQIKVLMTIALSEMNGSLKEA
jgi:hypothetical protein